jgi:ABC-2 type transport system ATP-binding protein
MLAIDAQGVSKRFGEVAALRRVGLWVREGEVVALTGSNGAGKSTLLRILATTVSPDSGTVMVAGHDALSDPVAVRQQIGVLLPDERSWYLRLSARANLEFFAALHGFSRREARDRARGLLAEMDLVGVGDRPLSGWSSGMRLRLALARAQLGRPRVLLLDEPTRSLDQGAREWFGEALESLVERTGASVVLASHEPAEVSLARRVVTLSEGCVVERASVEGAAQ